MVQEATHIKAPYPFSDSFDAASLSCWEYTFPFIKYLISNLLILIIPKL